MKITALIVTLACAMGIAQPKYLGTTNGVRHYVESIPVSQDMRRAVEYQLYGTKGETSDDLDLDLDKIINIGQSIWKIIEANKPVVNVKYEYANALPKGLKSIEDLEGFSDIQIHALRNYGVNSFGVTAYDVKTAAVHRFGGSYEGTGKYLENVTLLPQTVDAIWGYTLNMRVNKVSAVNVGTKEDPIGSLLMESELVVETVMKKSQTRQIFQFRGDSKDVLCTTTLKQ